MQESQKKDFKCEQLKGMKSSASKKNGKSQKRCFCSYFVSLFRETSMQSSCLQRIIVYQNNICQILDADIYINPKGGQELYDKQYFTDHGIQLYFIDSIFYPYKQFKNEFVGGLSMLDILMFNSKESISEMLDKYRLI